MGLEGGLGHGCAVRFTKKAAMEPETEPAAAVAEELQITVSLISGNEIAAGIAA